MKKKIYLFEPFCGSAALTLHLLGARRQLLPYQGSKWALRRQICGLIEEVLGVGGVTGGGRGLEVVGIHVNDLGPWGYTWGLLRDKKDEVVAELERMAGQDPRQLYGLIHDGFVPCVNEPLFAAQFLFLQRLSHSGKAVGTKERPSGALLWSSPGFNATSAYGVVGTDRFGQVKPMIPALIRQLVELPELGDPSKFLSTSLSADECFEYWYRQAPDVDDDVVRVSFIDPPYLGSTRYPNGTFDRPSVVKLALDMAEHGFFVVVSEAEPIAELVELGWSTRCVKRAPGHDAPFRAKGEEWLTYSLSL